MSPSCYTKHTMSIQTIILAAGKGSRMKSALSKVLHPLAGIPILHHVYHSIVPFSDYCTIVVGHQHDQIKASCQSLTPNPTFALQALQLGTGHAVQEALASHTTNATHTLILAGDCPLIQTTTLEQLLATHTQENASVTLLTAVMANPTGYGRILCNEAGHVLAIREQKDCSAAEAAVTEINSGTYLFKTDDLTRYINTLATNNNQGEYYLTDMIEILKENNKPIRKYTMPTATESIGINSRQDLAAATTAYYKRNAITHMNQGVTIVDPASTFIDHSVTIGSDSIIHPFTVIQGTSQIGAQCTIGPFAQIQNQTIPQGTTVTRNS